MMQRAGWIVLSLALAACDTPKPEADNAVSTPNQEPVDVSQPVPAMPVENAAAEPKSAAGHPCNIQDGKAAARKLKALGTEPFWAAEVDGRCVTYKTPEDQQGVRIWAKVSADETVWDGALNSRQFRLAVKPSPGCSDGMSDRTYPLEAVLRVNGETRKGCAEPL